jgi:outer membrane receptor protein involved in Fe transport
VLDGDNTSGFFYSSRLNTRQFFGVPGWNEMTESDYYRVAALVDHRFNEDSAISLRASSTRVDKTLFDSSPRNGANGRVVAANGDVQIRPLLQTGEGESDTVVAEYKLNLQTGSLFEQPVEHKLLFRADFERIYNEATSASAVSNVVYNVETDTYTFPAGGIVLGAPSSFGTDALQYGFVAQDLVSLGEQWHVLGGLRYSRFDNRLADVQSDDLSPRTGLVYRPRRNLSFYGSWARGFVPTTATGFNPATGNGIGGAPLDPEQTEQFELGARYSLFEDGLILNAAIFDLRKKDIAVTDPASGALPANEQWSANLGETRTRGFEFQAVGRVTSAFRLIAGYAYLDNELLVVDPAFAGQEGNRLPGIPEHSGSLWGVYEFQDGPLRGLGLGLGAFAQTDIFASTENRAEYGGWVQLDAMAYYKRDRWKFQVNVRNFTDREYNLAQALTTTDSFAAIRVGTSSPLLVNGSISYEF